MTGRLAGPAAIVLLSLVSQGGHSEEGDLGVAAGPGTLYPAISLTESYNDNIFLTDTARRSSLVTVVAPSAAYELDGEISRYRLEAGLTRGWYHDSPADDFLDRNASATAEFDPSPRFLASATVGYRYGHEARGTGANEGAAATAVSAPDEFSVLSLGGKVRYGLPTEHGAPVLDLSAAYATRDYQNNRASTRFRDRNETRLGAVFSYYLSPVTAVLLEGRVHRFAYKTGTNDNTEYAVLTGATWDITNLTAGYAKLGWKRKVFSNSGFQTTSNPFWELGVRWKPLRYSVFGVAASRQSLESNGTGDYIDERAVALTWDHDWRSYLSTAITVDLARQDYPGAARRDDVRQLGVVMRYLSRWWLTFEAGYTHAQRDSNSAGLDYENNTVSVGVRVAL